MRQAAGEKSAEAFRTIGEVAAQLDIPQHVLRFWESKFTQVKPLKRGGGRRYYRPEDVDLLRRIRELLYVDGYTVKGVQKLLRESGVKSLVDGARVSLSTGPTGPAGDGAAAKQSEARAAGGARKGKRRGSLDIALADLIELRDRLRHAVNG
jgi:DNA-binding transcriptional MerR regulator